MAKKIDIKKPGFKSVSSDQWVKNKGGTKRLTIDLDASLHMRLKVLAANQGKAMSHIIRDCLDSHFRKN